MNSSDRVESDLANIEKPELQGKRSVVGINRTGAVDDAIFV